MSASSAATASQHATTTAFSVLAAISFCHLLNDMMQSLLPALYPILKENYALTFGQIGIVTFTFQVTASLLQPVIGAFTDKRPQPYSLATGMAFTFLGLLLLVPRRQLPRAAHGGRTRRHGLCSPASRVVARRAHGGRRQARPRAIAVSDGRQRRFLDRAARRRRRSARSANTASPGSRLAAIVAMVLLFGVGRWYVSHGMARMRAQAARERASTLSRRQVIGALAILVALMLSKFVYTASMSSYYTFYLIERFGVEVPQLLLFVYLGSVAIGTVVGGVLGDRFGRKFVIWFSILGVLPFTLALPYANLFWTGVLTVPIGLILASAFPAIVVYGQELVPLKVGTVAGLFFGLAFGLGGVGAALLGQLADAKGIEFVFSICSFLPALGLLAAFLPHTAVANRLPAKT